MSPDTWGPYRSEAKAQEVKAEWPGAKVEPRGDGWVVVVPKAKKKRKKQDRPRAEPEPVDAEALRYVKMTLAIRETAEARLEEQLRGLSGTTRQEAFRACLDAGVGVSDLGRLAGLSRQRIHKIVGPRS